MSSVSEYFKGLFGGIGGLLTGMSVTIKELFTKKVTQEYPENRKTLVISERFRGELNMPHDENNEHACTACGICQTNCPNGTIKVVSKMIETEDGKKKKILDRYFYNLGMCTFCNLCVITCPFGAIRFENTFENAIFTKAKLNMQLNHEGSKLKEKKKPAPAPKPAAEKQVTEDKKPAVSATTEKADTTPPAPASTPTSEKGARAEQKPVEKQKEEMIDVTGKPIEDEGKTSHPPKSQIDSNPGADMPASEKPAEKKDIVIKSDNNELNDEKPCGPDKDPKNDNQNKFHI